MPALHTRASGEQKKNMKKQLLVILEWGFIITLMSCNNPFSTKNDKKQDFKKKDSITHIYVRDTLSNHELLKKKIDSLIRSGNTTLADRLIDSIILKSQRKGFGYFQKGMIKIADRNFPIAILYFIKARDLNYKRKDCDYEIGVCQQFIRDNE